MLYTRLAQTCAGNEIGEERKGNVERTIEEVEATEGEDVPVLFDYDAPPSLQIKIPH